MTDPRRVRAEQEAKRLLLNLYRYEGDVLFEDVDLVLAFERQAEVRERERCTTKALEQRCERGTPWDLACLAIAKALREEGE